VETSACKALEVLGPKGAQFRCRGYDVVPIAPRWDAPETMGFWDQIIEFWGPDIDGWMDGGDGWQIWRLQVPSTLIVSLSGTWPADISVDVSIFDYKTLVHQLGIPPTYMNCDSNAPAKLTLSTSLLIRVWHECRKPNRKSHKFTARFFVKYPKSNLKQLGV